MNATELLAELGRRGIRLWTEGGKLRFDAPRGAFDETLREAVRELREEVMVLLGDSGGPSGPRPVPRDGDPLPLSSGQQRLWFLNELAPEDRAYNVPATVHLRGALDEPALRRALDEIVRRHEVLRTHMPADEGKARLVIEPVGPAPLTVEDVPGETPEARLAEATRLARADAVQPFDLAAGPLLRIRLFRLAPDEHVLHVLMHHIISDGWSMGVFFRELAALYEAFTAGLPSPLAELPIQYADHAAWQQSPDGLQKLQAGLDWWARQLDGELPVLALPTDRPRSTAPSSRGASLWFPIERDLRDALLQLSRREGVTRFQLLLSAFLVLLARHTGQDELVLGTPVAGRSRREIEGLIGFFVNNLVLRADVSGDPTFPELLARVRGMALDAFAHQDTPFEKIVDAVAPQRELGRNPLFQVLFNHFDLSEFTYALPPVELDTIDMTLDVSKFDLTLHCFEKDEILVAKFEYDTELFDEATIAALGERFEVLLRGIVDDPRQRISRLPVLTDTERRRLLVDCNRGEIALPEAQSVQALFAAQAARTPEAPALVFEQQRLSFAELQGRAEALAGRLVEVGVQPETRVALFLERSEAMIVALLGVLGASGAYVPIDPSTPPDRVAFQLRDADCRVVLTRGDCAGKLPPTTATVLDLDSVDLARPPASPLPPGRPGQLAYVVYTSGSTGEPKGVEVEQAQLLDYLAAIRPTLGVPEGARYATVSTLAADLGNTCIFPALCHGGCLHVLSEERLGDGDAFAEVMTAEAVDVLKIVPGHLAGLLAAAARPADVLPRTLLVLGGEACTWELVERVHELAPGCRIVNHYGPAETTVGVVAHELDPDDCERHPAAPPLGRPLPNTQVYLVDRQLQPVPTGCVGELLVGGGGVTRGYLGRPELTAERFVADAFRRGSERRLYRTGDLARWTGDGVLVFEGRADDQVKIRGHRVEPGEVAAALEARPDVAQAVVIVRRDGQGLPRLHAYAVPGPGGTLDVDELRADLASRLPEVMRPHALMVLERLPLTPNGKLDRRALPVPDADQLPGAAAFVAPRTADERTLADIWCDVLRLERVGVHDDFFELGGESILSIQIVSRANQAGLRLKPRDVFQWSTIAELAAATRVGGRTAIESGPARGDLPLTPIQHRFFAQELARPAHYNHAMLLCTERPLGDGHLRTALAALELQHDVLRLRFRREGAAWRQTVVEPGGEAPLAVHDLTGSPPDELDARLASLCAEAQASLDLEHGPLWRALRVHLGHGRRDRLLLVVHHLAVDGVSWRLLLEDLSLACEQLAEGREPALGARTTSYKAWAEALVRRAADGRLLPAARRWLDDDRRRVEPLPRDLPSESAACTAAQAETLELSLDEERTERLLRVVPRAYSTGIDDVLLTALARACAPWTGSERLLVDVEGHGREDDLVSDVDTSRSVGWFTSVRPVLLDVQGAADPGEALCAVKEQLRGDPLRGLAWGLLRWLGPEALQAELAALPAAQVGFNFMGHFDRSLEVCGLFRRAPESPGLGTAPANRRPYLLDVGGSVVEGRLQLSLTWSNDVHARATIEELGRRLLDALDELIEHCTAPGAGRRTPSDFPLARLDDGELAALEAHFGAERVEDVYRLSPLQRGLVFHSLADAEEGSDDDRAYVTQLALTLHGELDVEAFRAAWQSALQANPILRTAFVVQGLRELHQVVCRDVPLRWSSDDWSELASEVRAERLDALARSDRQRGFDLAEPPLMQLRLVRLGPDRQRLLWTHHHVLLDGWSLPLLVRDVFTAYSAGGAGELPARRPFAEYVRWIDAQDEDDSAAFWSDVLDGWSGTTPLPAAGSRAGGEAGVSRAALGKELSSEATAALTGLARREHLTLNTLVQGAWALLLSRHAACTDVVYGVTVSGRPPDLPGVESMLGLFINTLPVRVDTSDGPLLPWLSELQGQLLEVQQRQATPLYEIRQYAGVSGQAQLFESLVVFENYPVEVAEPVHGAGLRIEDASDVSHATYPLVLVAQPRERLFLELRHDARRYDEASVSRLLDQLMNLLVAMAARPEVSLAELPLLTDTQRRAQLGALNSPTSPDGFPRDASVAELFGRRARLTPDAPALEYAEERLTYAELDARAASFAARLQERGLVSGQLVALPLAPGAGLVVAMLAVLKAGGAYLPMDPDEPGVRAESMLRDSGAVLLVADDGSPARSWSFDGGVLDPQSPDGASPPAAVSPVRVGGDDLAYVIYTSGSTGEPKGTAIPQRGITRLVLGSDYVQLGPEDRVAQMATPSFDAATFEIWGPLLNGGCIVGVPKTVALSPPDLARTLRERRVTTLFVTTALFNQLVQHEPEVFACLDTLLFGGEAVSPQHVRTVLERGAPGRLLHVYGPTECTTFSTWHEVTEVPADAETVPIGRSVAHSTAYVLDAAGQPVAPGALGELVLGGAGVALGYHGRPELTAERFVPDPFDDAPGARLYRTGDLVRLTTDGVLEFVGRGDEQVKLRGFRIEPGEIEAALAARPGVEAAAVLLREDEPGDKRLVAYVAAPAELADELAALREALSADLPAWMIPDEVLRLDALPLNRNGKLDRRALPRPVPRRGGALSEAPRSDVERRVAGIWREVLGGAEVGFRDNFFDVGGHSLKLLALQARLAAELGSELSITDLFQHTTVEAQARALTGSGVAAGDDTSDGGLRARSERQAAQAGGRGQADAIAVVAMAGRFPGADSVESFWDNLCGGVESIRRFGRDELLAAGLPAELVDDPRYVPARAVLDDPDRFDARFFGYTPLEAELMDPQQRLFLECCHDALERACIDPEREPGRVGVFGGASMNSYLDALRTRPEVFARAGGLASLISSIHDFLTTRVSYQLNLRGPSVNIQSACSTSLVTVHEACRALLEGRCDTALAGGVSVTVPWVAGYVHETSGVRSADGHCRTFDASADGMVSGNGVGVVVLERLSDAVARGHQVHAVIRGTAVNNDGARKVGFTAPSIEGQAEVIATAQSAGGVDPRSIGYVECHGTGTALGDPIEVAALTRVFREATDERGFCAVASLKSNMGHLDAAAGVAGFIKAALAVRDGLIPPSLHFERPNPEIDFPASPFFVNTALRAWRPDDGAPRRAGVSAFGIGGTNAHAVLEQPPETEPSGPSRDWQLLQLTARTPEALERMTVRLAEHLRAHDDLPLADVAHSLRTGRREFAHRRALLCRDTADALRTLDGEQPERRWTRHAVQGRRVVFLFPGQGSQHADMGRALYRAEPVYREVVDDCLERLRRRGGPDLRPLLVPDGGAAPDEETLHGTQHAQPALFVVEYALAQLWLSWGVTPVATIGHSVGEYTSACLAGVLELDDALYLVSERGRLMAAMPPGAMLAVSLGEEALVERIAGRDDLWLAAINGPRRCVVSGAHDVVAEFERQLQADGVGCALLRTSHGFHSGLMQGAVAPFAEVVRGITRRAPTGIPYVSSLTGERVGAADVADVAFWTRQIVEPVRWTSGLARLLEDDQALLLEVGPGRTLAALARAHPDCGRARLVLASLPGAGEDADEQAAVLGVLGRLWTAGVAYQATAFAGSERRRCVTLPTYPFERERYWIERRDAAPEASPRQALDDWFSVPVWRPTGRPSGDVEPVSHALVFAGSGGVGQELADRLAADGVRVTVVRPGVDFAAGPGSVSLAPSDAEQHARLLDGLLTSDAWPQLVVHAWSADDGEREPTDDLDHGLLSLTHVARAATHADVAAGLRLVVVTRGVHDVRGGERLHPERAAAVGVVRTLGLEEPRVQCQLVDLAHGDDSSATLDALVREVRAPAADAVVALREGVRWVEAFVPVPLEAREATSGLAREGGVYLITGGLGGMGLALARGLHDALGARLVLLGRTELPERGDWDAWLAEHPADDEVARRLIGVRALEAGGADVLVASGDVSDAGAMAALVNQVRVRFGALHGVIHAAGVPPGGLLMTSSAARVRSVLAPKVAGARALLEAVAPCAPDFVVLCSSLNAVKGFPGASDYSAANACLDAQARSVARGAPTRVLSLAWNRWRESGMAVAAAGGPLAADQGISDAEGVEVLLRVLAHDPGPNVLISERPLHDVLREPAVGEASRSAGGGQAAIPPEAAAEAAAYARPDLGTDFVAPSGEFEQLIADAWQELFGISGLGVHDDFFDLGGHSLLATQLLARLQQRWPDAGLSLRVLFDHPNIAAQAAFLEAQAAAPEVAPGEATRPGPIVRRDADQEPDLDALSDAEVAEMLRRLADEQP